MPDLYRDMVASLKKNYPSTQIKGGIAPSYIVIEELRVGTGYKGDNEQRIDVWIMESTGRNGKIAVEIKVSRSDFLTEMKKPLKRRPGLRLSNLFYFYAPKGMIKPTEVPPECGLWEYSPPIGKEGYDFGFSRNIEETVKAPWRDVFPPTWSFICSMYRNLDKQHKLEIQRQLEEIESKERRK